MDWADWRYLHLISVPPVFELAIARKGRPEQCVCLIEHGISDLLSFNEMAGASATVP